MLKSKSYDRMLEKGVVTDGLSLTGSGSLSDPLVGPVKLVEVTLTHAQILSLGTPGYQLLAGETGKTIIPIDMVLCSDFSAGAYNEAFDCNLNYYDGVSLSADLMDLPATIFNSTTKKLNIQPLVSSQITRALSMGCDLRLVTSGTLTGGNNANRLLVSVTYRLVTPL